MSSNDEEQKGYSVGRGRPPRHSQFKPGRSGNPSGKRKGVKGLATLLADLMQEKIRIVVGGKTRRVPRQEALLAGFISDALRGKEKTRNELLNILFRQEQERPADATSSDQDEKIVQLLMARMRGADGRSSPVGEGRRKRRNGDECV